jgi:hypothetical protein
MIGKILAVVGIYIIGKQVLHGAEIADKQTLQDRRNANNWAKSVNNKAIRAENNSPLYKILNGRKIAYTSYQAYVNDGKPEIVTVSNYVLSLIIETTNAKITENGYKQGAGMDNEFFNLNYLIP